MNTTFETFKPKSSLIKPYVDYYYLDIKPDNKTSEFQCFPHFNNTISLYRSHIQKEKGHVVFDENAAALQILLPSEKKYFILYNPEKSTGLSLYFILWEYSSFTDH